MSLVTEYIPKYTPKAQISNKPTAPTLTKRQQLKPEATKPIPIPKTLNKTDSFLSKRSYTEIATATGFGAAAALTVAATATVFPAAAAGLAAGMGAMSLAGSLKEEIDKRKVLGLGAAAAGAAVGLVAGSSLAAVAGVVAGAAIALRGAKSN